MTEQRTGSSLRRYAPAVLVVLLALLRPLGTLLGSLIPNAAEDASAYAIAVIAQQLILWLLPSLFFRPWRIRRLGPKRQILPVTVTALFCGAAIQLFFSQLRTVLPDLAQSARTIPMPETVWEWLLAVPALVLLPAVCEEAFFRGGLLPHMADITGTVKAFVLSTLMFALMHADPAGLPAHLTVSACCVLLMLATGRLLPAVLLHLGFNAAALVMQYLPESPFWFCAGLLPAILIAQLVRSIDWKNGKDRHMGREDLALTVVLLVCMTARYFF